MSAYEWYSRISEAGIPLCASMVESARLTGKVITEVLIFMDGE